MRAFSSALLSFGLAACLLALLVGLVTASASGDEGAPDPKGFRKPFGSGSVFTDQTGWFTFTLPWDDAAATMTDAADLLLDAPGQDPATVIDARGFVTTTADGHFAFTNTGKRARFWGTNLTFSAAFPPSPDYPPEPGEFGDVAAAEKLAGRLAKLGFNAVRLHHLDNWARPSGIWLQPWENTLDLDPVQLGRLDWLIYQLKRHAIYVDLGLHVSRNFTLGDGVTAADKFEGTDVWYNKGATLFDPVMIALQARYAAQLLDHVNPYTGLAYRNDPVILTTETTNEDSFFLSFVFDGLNYSPAEQASFPEFYSTELDGWTHLAGQGPTINRLRNPGFEDGLTGWYTYTAGAAQATYTTTAGGVDGGPALKVTVGQSDGMSWHVQFGQADLALQVGHVYRLRFAVRGDLPATIEGYVMRDGDPWDPLGWAAAINVTTSWVTHTIEFTATETIFGGGRVSFNVGQAVRTLWFDNFLFQEADAFRGWLGWLEDRYGSTAALAVAWAPTNPVPETQMLVNGSFEAGLTDWYGSVAGGAAATGSIDPTTATSGTQSLKVVVTQVDGTSWHVQFAQGGLAIQAGQRYVLRFDAKTDVPGPFNANVMQNHDPWEGLGLWGEADAGTEWQTFEFSFKATTDDPDGRVSFDLGQSVRTLWFDNVSLRPYNPVGLLPGESLEGNNVARLRRSQLIAFTPQRVRDTLRFYDETQRAYFTGMRAFIQSFLNTGTACYSLADISAMADLDFVDNHFYWDHPSWPEVPPWSPTGWFIRNESWLNSPFNGLFDLAATAVKGKPFTVTEFNQPFPNRYAVEAPLLFATIGNLQEWDAVFQFAYSHDQNNYDADRVTGFFDLAGNPLATGLMPVAARLFLGQQTAPASLASDLAFTQDERYESAGFGWGGSLGDFLQEAKGISNAALFGSRLRIADFAAPAPVTPTLPTPAGPVYRSAGGQLTWDASDPGRGLYTFDAGQAQGAVGFLAGRAISLTNLALDVPADTAQFAAVTLQSRDGLSLTVSTAVLLGVFTRVENTGQVWNAAETSLDDRWGAAPALIEPIRLTITLTVTNPSAVQVWALDETGAQQTPVPTEVVNGTQVRFAVNTGTAETVWFGAGRVFRNLLPLISRHAADAGTQRSIWFAVGRPLAGPVSSVGRAGDGVRLTWPAVPGAELYRLYRAANDPYFTPVSPYTTTYGTAWTDVGILGDPAFNYTYAVQAVNRFGESDVGNRAGKFEFALAPGAP